MLYPHRKSPWYPLDRRLGGPQSQPGCGGEEKNSQPLLGLKLPIVQLVFQCYTTELSWLLVFELNNKSYLQFMNLKVFLILCPQRSHPLS
jgi:hypothetical protein